MKKLLVLGIVSMVLFLMVGPASAWVRYTHYPHGRPHFGFFIAPPVFFVPPPPAVRYYYERSYPPDYYGQDDRVWVSGHWENRQAGYGWERVWVPGHWEWR